MSQKEAGVYGGSAPVTLREAQPLRTLVRFYASKALKGVWGKNKSFSPTVFCNLLLISFFDKLRGETKEHESRATKGGRGKPLPYGQIKKVRNLRFLTFFYC